MKQQHTPAPWVYDKPKESNGYIWINSENGLAGDVATAWGADGEELANARLITAAPDLLEALNGMIAIVNDSRGVYGYHLNGDVAEWDCFDEVTSAIAAIAKATGE